MQTANRALARERHVRLANRLREIARARDLGEPAACVVEAPQRERPRSIRAEVRSACALDHLVIRVDRLAGVAPVALEHVEPKYPGADVMVVDVRDLELAARRRFEITDVNKDRKSTRL